MVSNNNETLELSAIWPIFRGIVTGFWGVIKGER